MITTEYVGDKFQEHIDNYTHGGGGGAMIYDSLGNLHSNYFIAYGTCSTSKEQNADHRAWYGECTFKGTVISAVACIIDYNGGSGDVACYCQWNGATVYVITDTHGGNYSKDKRCAIIAICQPRT